MIPRVDIPNPEWYVCIMVDSTKNEHRFELKDFDDDGPHFFKNVAQPYHLLQTQR